MANISTVWTFLKQNSDHVGDASLANDFLKAYNSAFSNEPYSNESINNYTSLATALITYFTERSAAGNAIAIRVAAAKLQTDAGQFALGTTSFADVVQSFGGLIEAIGIGMQQPTLNSIGLRVEVAGIMIGAYGSLLEAAGEFGNSLDTYGWWQSVTQTDAKREAEIYATGLARSLDKSFSDATAKVFIDGSKSNDTGIGESVEYIKNIRQLLGLGTEFTAATANDVFSAVQESNVAIHTLYGTSKFQISGVSNARNDLSAFLSLYYLIPFSIKPTDAGATDKLYQLHATIADQWNDDRNLTSEQIANGEANFSDMYLADRAAMLGWVSKSNLDDTAGRADGLEAIYADFESGTYLSPLIVSNTQKFIFGENDAEAIAGSNKADHLYGGGGDDNINAGEGNDYLEGNAGADTLNGGSMQFKPQGFSHFQNSRKIRHTLARKRFIQTLTAHARIFSHLGHTLCARNITQGLGDEGRIAVTFLDARIQIQSHFLRRTQVFSYIKFTKTGFHDLSPLQCNLFGKLNIFSLARFIAYTQHNDYLATLLCVINTVTRPKKQPQLTDAITHATMIPKITQLNSREPSQHAYFHMAIRSIQPHTKLTTFDDFNHAAIVANRLQKSSVVQYFNQAANDNEWRMAV